MQHPLPTLSNVSVKECAAKFCASSSAKVVTVVAVVVTVVTVVVVVVVVEEAVGVTVDDVNVGGVCSQTTLATNERVCVSADKE